MKPNPYNLTFHDEADGGPLYLLYLLREHNIRFRKDGKDIAEGTIVEVNEANNTVTVREYGSDIGIYDGAEHTLNVYEDFDEAMYL